VSKIRESNTESICCKREGVSEELGKPLGFYTRTSGLGQPRIIDWLKEWCAGLKDGAV
jgi:hypothetical protein